MDKKISATLTDIFDEMESKAALEERARQDELRLKNALQTVLSLQEGRLVFAWVLSHSSLNSSISVPDSLRMAMLSGRRDVGLEISNKLRALCPELLEKLNKENE